MVVSENVFIVVCGALRVMREGVFMRPPVTKLPSPMENPVLREGIMNQLASYQNKFYSSKKPCPFCGSENINKSVRTRLFCKLIISAICLLQNFLLFLGFLVPFV
nr:hypothetical protein [Candidatus Freyarchaeota archaeon]